MLLNSAVYFQMLSCDLLKVKTELLYQILDGGAWQAVVTTWATVWKMGSRKTGLEAVRQSGGGCTHPGERWWFSEQKKGSGG